MQNDALQFFGPGHSFVDFLLREFELEGDGRCAAAKLTVSSHNAGRLFAFMVLRTAPNLDALGSTGLSPALRLRIAEQLPQTRQPAAFELLPNDSPPVLEISEDEVELAAKLRASSDAERISAAELNAIAPLARIWNAAAIGVAAAIATVRANRKGQRQEAGRRLEESLKFDRTYVKWRAAQGDTNVAEDLESFDRAALAIEAETVTVDSIYLVLGVAPQ
jgi:hypothetical protein